jgi:hypothetical protein
MRDIFVFYYKVEIYYIVPFDKKDIAKSQKMLWNPKRKCWYKFYKYDCVELIDLYHNFEIKEIIGDIPDEHIEYIVKEHENLRNSYLLEKKKRDEQYEIMDLEAEFEYLTGQISKDDYERYLSYNDL